MARKLEGPTIVERRKHQPLPANTTYQQDLIIASQRKVNLIWEYTQSVTAIVVILSTILAAILSMIYGWMIPNLLAVAFGTIVGFYFGRTNHASIGGIGPKPIPEIYTGR